MDSVSGRNTIEPLNEIRFGGKDGSCRGKNALKQNLGEYRNKS
jgi:hypothetical protein